MVKKKRFFGGKKQKYVFTKFKTLINYYPSPNTFFFGINYLFGVGFVVRTGVLTSVFFSRGNFASLEKYAF